MSADATLQAKPSVVVAPIGDEELALLDVDRGLYYGLNQVGFHVWKRLEAGATLPMIVQTITDTFDVPDEQCAKDVAALVEQLETAGLIVRNGSPQHPPA